ncbi:MAG: DUF2065 domain-containing protein [Thermodesulfobacteriota bacterium]|nr:DUF2065 domain-containing protein [Thermodesulfobacteriota bacterium]
MGFLIAVFGAVLVIEGLPYLFFPEKMKEFMNIIIKVETNILRLLGISAITIGLLILYVSRGD